ncbi:MAG: DNA polymerase delta subunit [Trebouxia sp. A1-2]|nr:MAG: DNA polymerase delta subunit [Trebouxia sp. A1-2]
MHVYSLQPTQPKDASELWNHDAIQTSELFQELRLGQTNCLADNRWSAVKCIEAKHDPSLAKRAPKPAAAPSTDAAGPSKPAQKPAPNSAAGQIAGIMAGSSKQGGVATASVAVKGSGSSSIQDSAEAQPMERDSGTTAIAPSGSAPLSGPTSGGPSAVSAPGGGQGGGKKKGGKSRLANMWSKAPAVKEKPQQPARSKAQAAPAVDADAALRSAQQAGSSSDSEEEELLPMKRPAQQRSKRIEEEEEEEEDDLLVKPVGRQAKKARTSGSDKTAAPARARQTALQESEGDEEEAPAQAAGSPVKTEVNKSKGKATAANKKKTAAAPKKPPAKKGLAKKSAAKQIQSDDEMSNADIEGEPDLTQDEEGGTSQAGKGRKGTKRAAANKPGTVKAGNAAGPKRRKVMHTAINDRGEEVTEEVWEDSQDASTPEEQDEQADRRQPKASAAEMPVSKSPEKALQDDALKEQPGNGVTNAGKPAVTKPNKSSGPAAKRGGSKAAVKDQRGIMSFFAKK